MDALKLAQQLTAIYVEKYNDSKPNALIIHGADKELEAAFDELCEAYSQAPPDECEQVRQVISTNRILQAAFLGHAIRASRNIQTSADLNWLRLGLAAASIENERGDYRDTLLVLAELYVRGEQTGMEPGKEFKQMAGHSDSAKPRGGITSMRELLSNFDTYAILAERRNRKNHGYFDK
jgi:hypothetical protein